MDRQEGVPSTYSKKWATFQAYDGRQLDGYAYIIYKEPGSEERNPSSRYLELLIKGTSNSNHFVKMIFIFKNLLFQLSRCQISWIKSRLHCSFTKANNIQTQ